MASRRHTSADGRKWDSKFEWRMANWCDNNGVTYDAQPRSFSYTTPVVNGTCMDCSSTEIVKQRSYTPDFLLHGSDFYVEAKGYLKPEARALLQYFIKSRRDIPIRFVFQSNQKLPLKRTPRYLDWAKSVGCEAIIWDDRKGFEKWL